MLDHHQNFERLTWQGLSLTFGLFQSYSLGYSRSIASASLENQEKVGLNFLSVIIYQSRILVLACHEFLVFVYR